MEIRRFDVNDVNAVRKLIERNLREINNKDYSAEYIEEAVKKHNEAVILDRAGLSHMYVACEDEKIVGCGTISSYWGSMTESILLTIFVLPEYHGNGIGRAIINTLEQDEFFKRAKRIEIPASITSSEFYKKMGYEYKNGVKTLNDEGCYRMEKFNQ